MHPNDRIVRDHHVQEAYNRAIRRQQKEPNLPRGPGNSAVGSIYDCNRKQFERLLTNYWNRLFVGWNPFKLDGKGCWEVWQRPIKRQELNDMEHWVADLPYLRLDFVKDLERMDAWAYKKSVGRNMDEDMDRAEIDLEIKQERDENERIRYAVRHYKSAFGKLKSLAQDGYNPLWFFSDKGQGRGEV